MKTNSIKSLYATCMLILLSSFMPVYGQTDEGFIYGTITTIEDATYTGQLRWGKEEAFWTDHFNAGKEENENLDWLSREQIAKLRRSHHSDRWSNWSIDWSDDDDDDWFVNKHLHQFVCQFGDMKSIEVTGRSRALVTMQNGDKIKVNGEGYNDIGTKVRVMDDELGLVSIRWSEIDKVEFQATPAKLKTRMGVPLFGEVVTTDGSFTGFVQWDHDERLSEDKLDGDTDDGDLSIPFGNIRKIVSRGSSCVVTMKSDRKFTLDDSNDVDRGNRGIIVTMEDGSRIDIPWDEFESVTFKDKYPTGKKYKDFANQTKLSGSVKTKDGKTHTGRIIYDLDEAYSYEIIQGKNDDLEYLIPLNAIKQITPRNYDNSYVVLKDGRKLLLGDAQDVSDRHDGILVFKGEDDASYISWEDVEEVSFN